MEIELDRFREKILKLQSSELPEADVRYAEFCKTDPFPEIPPALLHAGHVASYIIATGMVDPFDVEALAKPATMLVPLEGDVRFKDETGEQQRFYLSRDPNAAKEHLRVSEQFCLKPNSLCYVTLRPMFRLPIYIGGRFNLQIRDVYRGLLVGTGPLVDPGFVGKLSIPVHNFTNTPYVFDAGEPFVYFEFTKLSWPVQRSKKLSRPSWLPEPIDDQPPFPSSKKRRKSIDDYLREATGSGAPQSVLASEIAKLQEQSEEQQTTFRRYSTYFKWGALGAAVAFVVALGGLIFTSWQLIISAQDYARSVHESASAELKSISTQQREFETRLDQIDGEIEQIRRSESEQTPP